MAKKYSGHKSEFKHSKSSVETHGDKSANLEMGSQISSKHGNPKHNACSVYDSFPGAKSMSHKRRLVD